MKNQTRRVLWNIALCTAILAFVGYLFWDSYEDGQESRRQHRVISDKLRRFDRICTSVEAPLKLARDRVRRPDTVESGRDIAVVIAPVVGQCTGVPAYQSRLEALATSNDAARDAAVIQEVLDETSAP